MQRSRAANEIPVFEKPNKTYLELIKEAFLFSNLNSLNAQEICQYISGNYPFYNLNDKYWQKRVSCNLSNKLKFIEVNQENQKETLKYMPVDQETIEENLEANELESQIKWATDECKKLNETIKKQRKDHCNQVIELRYEYQIKLAKIDNEISTITEMFSDVISKK